MRYLKAALAVLTLTSAAATCAGTLTFDLPAGTYIQHYDEGGFRASGAGYDGSGYFFRSNSVACVPTCADNGTFFAGLGSGYYGAGSDALIVESINGKLFNLVSFDAAEFPNNSSDAFAASRWSAGVRVTGLRSFVPIVSEEIALDQINDGFGGVADFQTFGSSVVGGFDMIVFSGIPNSSFFLDFALDNIVLAEVEAAAVPEPGSIALLGVGLMGLAALRRKIA